VVHHLVVFEEVLADVEVALFDLLLGRLDPPRDHVALDRLAFFHAEPGEDAGDPLAGEDAHQVVLQREIEPARAGVALTAGAAAELIVDAPRLVPFGADDVQPAHLGDLAAFFFHLLFGLDVLDCLLPQVVGYVKAGGILVLEPGPGECFRVAAEDDVGAAAGHVGGDGHGADAAGLGDDLGLAAACSAAR